MSKLFLLDHLSNEELGEGVSVLNANTVIVEQNEEGFKVYPKIVQNNNYDEDLRYDITEVVMKNPEIYDLYKEHITTFAKDGDVFKMIGKGINITEPEENKINKF